MKKLAKIKDVLNIYKSKGITGVSEYLLDEELDIREETWIHKAKSLLDSKNFKSLEAEITLILFNFKLSENEEN